MNNLPFILTQYWTVSELNRYLHDLFEDDLTLQDIWVQGEVSNLSQPSSGHLYFTLKDSSSALKCVMWRNTVMKQTFLPREGQAIEIHGSVGIYEAGGQYQLYSDLIRAVGEGALYQEFLRRKGLLEAEGLFNLERKRRIPKFVKQIGVITSPTGAAFRDIINTINRRFPLVEVILAPTVVQGEEAPSQIIDALLRLNQNISPDVIIIARGGGSIEDLWAFNDEGLARAIVSSASPVISGIGHETDFTIADFVSDIRAPTPTAAAEIATPNFADLLINLSDYRIRLERTTQTFLDKKQWQFNQYQHRLSLRSPLHRIQSNQQKVDETYRRIILVMEHYFDIQRARTNGLEQKIASLNPQSILKRGYAIITHLDNRLVSSVHHVQVGDELNVNVQDGEFSVRTLPSRSN